MSRHPFGRNYALREEDVVLLHVHEAWTPETFSPVVQFLSQVDAESGGIFLIVRAYIENPLPPEVRRTIATHATQVNYKRVIVIGGSAIYRSLMHMMSRAVSLVSGKPASLPLFVADEASARAAVEKLRKSAGKGPGSGDES